MQPQPRRRGHALSAALLAATAATAPALVPALARALDPAPSTPRLTAADPPAVVVAIYGVPPSRDPWEVQGRVRAVGPLMSIGPAAPGALFPIRAFQVSAEVSVGPVTVEGGYALVMGAHESANTGTFNVGGAWTFDDGYATGQGQWQGRLGGAIGYAQALSEYGEYGFERWHGVSMTASIDGTWWFSRPAGLELRLAGGALIPFAFSGYDTPGVGGSHDLSAGDLLPFVQTSVGLVFGR